MSVMFLLRTRTCRIAAAALVSGLLLAIWIRVGPLPAGLLDGSATSTLVVDRSGVPLYEALSAAGTRAVTLTADTLPPILVEATIAAEDRRFDSHPGVDPVAILRAVKTNLVEGTVVEGASTISQQVAKLLLNRQQPGRRRGWRAKMHEAVLALRLEHRFTKREMLALYMNLASYGNQIVGVERASRAYFGVPASMLTPAQAALLAGLPQRPSGFNPYRNPKATAARQRSVLRRMQAAGALSAEQAQLAREERLAFARGEMPFSAPHFVEMVLASVKDARPTRIDTTLDSQLQADVAGIIHSHRAALIRHGAANVAVVVLDNASGEWLAWEGSGDYTDHGHGGTINGPVMARQPGSALKPFTYALAFEEGFSPASALADVPSHFPTAQPGVVYSPRNYDGRYRGPLLARRALAGSENVPAVALASELGVPSIHRFLSRAGLTTFDKSASFYGLGFTLGNAEVRLDELVAAYAAFARGGDWIEPTYLRGAATRRRAGERRRTLVSARTAFWITDILSDPHAREYAFGRGGSLEFPFPVAVKTGTSQAYHDNWTVGYSRDVTVGVWVGNFNRKPLRNSSGVTGAAPIFHAVMMAAVSRAGARPTDFSAEPIVSPPDDTHQIEICALSGQAANAWCPVRQREWMAKGAPPPPCSWHHLTDEGLVVIWPPEYREWAAKQEPDRRRTATRAAAASAAATPEAGQDDSATREAELRGTLLSGLTRSVASLRISNPPHGSTYLIDPTLRRDFQTLALHAIAPEAAQIEWVINGAVIGATSANGSFAWPLAPGTHRIEARDDRGYVDAATVTVR